MLSIVWGLLIIIYIINLLFMALKKFLSSQPSARSARGSAELRVCTIVKGS